jgi:acyl-coenzyme A thioesterase PaaI-like protein
MMIPSNDDWLTRVRAEYGLCFGCGLENPIGLHVDHFSRVGNTVQARFTPRDHYKGFHGVLHGGIIATALDEILAWTAILVAGTMAVTATMDMKFRKPASADSEYQLRGRLVERRGRRLVLEGVCSTGEIVIADARALFLAVDSIESAPAVE